MDKNLLKRLTKSTVLGVTIIAAIVFLLSRSLAVALLIGFVAFLYSLSTIFLYYQMGKRDRNPQEKDVDGSKMTKKQ